MSIVNRRQPRHRHARSDAQMGHARIAGKSRTGRRRGVHGRAVGRHRFCARSVPQCGHGQVVPSRGGAFREERRGDEREDAERADAARRQMEGAAGFTGKRGPCSTIHTNCFFLSGNDPNRSVLLMFYHDPQVKDESKRTTAVAKLFPDKNRTNDSIPYDHARVRLATTTDDYINACFVRVSVLETDDPSSTNKKTSCFIYTNCVVRHRIKPSSPHTTFARSCFYI